MQAALAAGNDVVGGRTPKISINGARPEMNSFLLDGTDINNVYNKTPGSAAGVLLGVEAVLEFQVLTFHDQILPKYYFFSGSLNPPFTTRTSIVNPPFPNVIANFDTNAYIRAQLQTVNADLQTPYIMQFNASVQRAITADLDVTAGYVGSRGHNLIRLGDANLAPETMVNGVKTYQPGAGRRNPNFTGVWQRMTDAESFYDSLQVSVNRRYSRGWRAQLSYTLSESTDDASGINSQDFSNNVQYVSDWYDLDMIGACRRLTRVTISRPTPVGSCPSRRIAKVSRAPCWVDGS